MKTNHPNLLLVRNDDNLDVAVLKRIGKEYLRTITFEEYVREFPEYELDPGTYDVLHGYFTDPMEQVLTLMSRNKGSIFTGSIPENSFEAQTVYVIRNLLDRVKKLEEWQHPHFSKYGRKVDSFPNGGCAELPSTQANGQEVK